MYRVVVIRNEEVVQGVLNPEFTPEHPVVRKTLAGWDGTHFLHQTPEGAELTLVRRIRPRDRERWWLHAVLAVLTILTTTIAGAYFAGADPVRLTLAALGPFGIPVPIRLDPAQLLPGLTFSVPLFMILLGHEMGHYAAGRRHGMDVSPPYFIPAPPWINLVGTFGAFIRLRSAMINRLMLLEVGAAGPLVSFVLSVPAVVVGAMWSRPLPPGVPAPAPYIVVFDGQPLWLGGSVLFDVLARAADGSTEAIILHPLAFAGWLGLFVTAMNLFPLAQLDGGHILYALIGDRQRWFGFAFLVFLIYLGSEWWGWWLWAGLILVLGRGSIGHPPVLDPEFPVGRAGRAVGWVCVVLFALTFVAIPIRF